MEEYIKYILAFVIILVLDVLWIYLNFKMYAKNIRNVQKTDLVLNYTYAFIAYALVVFASLYIAIPFTKNYLNKNDSITDKLYKSLIYGGSIGLAVYGIYNFTNLSIFKEYSLNLAIIDSVWGTMMNTFVVFVYTLL
jgi:uncharacterized membrane protein